MLQKKSFFTFFLSVVFTLSGIAGSTAQTAADTGKIELIQDQKVKALVQKHSEINASAPVKGYRVKIHFGADKARAKEVKAKFIARFPEVKAYEKYDQPNFNIRVGDFRTKLDAYRFLKEVQPEFPSAFIVQDEIELPSLELPVEKK
jgi:hypothetical protein